MKTRRDFLRTVIAAPAGIAAAHALAVSASASGSSKRKELFENFSNLNRWRTLNYPPRLVSTQPASLATNIGGRTSSCLQLTGTDPYSFQPGTEVELLDFEFSDGIIELDAYISGPALLDVCFRCNFAAATGYIGRLETRGAPYSDTFLDIGPWAGLLYNTSNTPLNQWIRMRIEARGSTLKMFKNSVEVMRVANATAATTGSIGFITEGSTVYVDNLRISKFD
jgi:hypothetical protein